MSQEAEKTVQRNKQPTILEAAKTITETLNESEIGRIKWVVSYLGVETSLALMKRTLEIEEQGGMLIKSGARRRTPGGVFFTLVKEGLSKQELRRVLPYMGYSRNRNNKRGTQDYRARRRGPQSKKKMLHTKAYQQLSIREQAQVAWEERREPVKELLKQSLSGEIDSMKIKLIGRPVNVTYEEEYVVAVVYSSERPPTLAKELPSISKVNLPYIVYIIKKQWEVVAKAIQYEDDALIIHGFLTYDINSRKMVIFALGITTQALLQAEKESQRALAKEGSE